MNVDVTKARSIFVEAVENHAADQWDNFLDDACGEDLALRRRVELLLKAHQGEDSFLDRGDEERGEERRDASPTIDQPITEKPGTQIGPYKLLQEIGEGGMGVVYMAEQTEPVKRRVALKLIKPGMDSRQVIARFEAERQALAIMDHPNMARVLDCGTTDSGHPYFIMELVKGVPITRYCDDNHLTPRQRLELFVPICQAIQHAHQKGIIHRDIKPSNILVAEYDQKPVPKIIDFGVAKALNQQLTEKTNFTVLGQVVGTIEYMSPEQARVNQLDVDTRSDIYSLGVLLYELLTGVTPFDRKRLLAAALDELLRIIREEEPPRPSTRLSTIDTLPSVAANRHTEPRKLSALLHGELDWIVMKALEKDRGRRYETANGFANDILRYLNDEAVQACPPSARYRFGKFARRNKVALVTSSLIVAALFFGIIGTGWQAIRATRAESKAETRLAAETKARKEANEAHAEAEISKQAALKSRDEAQTEATRANNVVKVLKSIFSSQDARDQTGVPKNYTVAQLFTDLADRLPAELSEEPAVEAEIRSIIGRAFVWNDSPLKAYPQFVEARRLREAIYPPDHPIHIESQLDLVDYYYQLGNYLKAHQIAGEILPRAKTLDGNVELKLRVYAAWIQGVESLPWIQRNGNRQAVFELAAEALDLAKANNETKNLITIQFNRISISHRFRELIQNVDKPADFDNQLRAIETAAEQALAACEDTMGKQYVGAVPFQRLLASIQAVQGHNATATDLLIRAFKTNQGLKIFGNDILEELRTLGMPESQIEKLTEQAPQVSNNFSLVEAIDRLTNNDVAGYRAEFEKLMQRNAAGDSQALVDVLFAAFASDDATNDWPALRDLALSSIDPGKYESGTETGNANLQANQCFVWPLIGGVLYRTNDLQQAVEILEESDQVHNEYESSSPGVDSSYYQVYRWYNWLFLSMSHHRLGNHQQSQKYFIRAATQIPRLLKNIEFQPGKLHEQTVSLLYREAFETIEFDPDEWIVDTSDDSELVARAEVYLLNGQRQKALLDYTAAIEQNPRNSLSRRLRAELLETERRFPEALADFSKAIELEPNRGELWNRRASCQYNSGRFEQAIDDWNRALELNPHQFWARLRRGLCHAKLGNRDLALRDYLATRVDPPPCGWRIERGKRLFDIQQFDEAVKDLSANPNDAGALRLRGLAYCQLGEFEKALADFDRLTTLNKNSDAWMYRAAVYRAMGDDDRAQAELDKNLKNSSNKAQAWFDFAMSLHNARMLDAAIDAHKKAAEFEPARPVATYNLACAYSLKNEKDNAFDALDKAMEYGFTDASLVSTDSDLANLRDDPRFEAIVAKMQWGTWYESGIAKANAGDNKQAIADLTTAIELNPKFVLAVYERGQLFKRIGDQEKAAADFERYNAALDAAVTENPSDWQAVNRRGIAYYNARRWDEAIGDFERAMELAPDESVLVHNRAACFLELQQWAQAAEDLARAIELDKANWQVHYHLALARLGAGDTAGYRVACRGMLAALSDSRDPLTANFVAWTCTLAPDAVEDWQPALKLARLAAEAQSGSLQNQNTLGTLLMRAGQTDEAIRVLSSVADQLAKPDASANTSPAYTWYALALAHQRAGSDEQALENLNKANASTDAALNDEANPPAWNRRLTLQLLRKEAETACGLAETNLPDTNPKPPQEEAKSAGTR